MWRKFAVVMPILIFAVGVLFTSVFRTASVKYEFDSATQSQASLVLGEEDIDIDYSLPFPGRVLPDNPFWPLKALRDRVWLWVTTNPSRRAELYLLFADKRLGGAKILFEKGKPEIGLSTLTKAEKYLASATSQEIDNRKTGIDTTEFLGRLANASLKHYQVMQEIYDMAPEEAKPTVVQFQDFSKRSFEEARNALLERGINPPENPFDW